MSWSRVCLSCRARSHVGQNHGVEVVVSLNLQFPDKFHQLERGWGQAYIFGEVMLIESVE